MSKLNLKGLRLFKKKNDKTYLKQKDTVDVMELAEETIVEDDDIIIKGQPETGDLVRIKASDFFAKVEDEIGELNSALTDKIIVQSTRSSSFDIAASSWVSSFEITFEPISGYTPYLIEARVGSGSSGYAYINIAQVSLNKDTNTITFGARNLNSSAGNFSVDYVILFIKD